MTPEEINRTIEFIIQSQARLAAAQEQDREDRTRFDQRLAHLLEVQTHLLAHQSERLDEYQKENRAAQRRHEEFREEARMRDEKFGKEARAAQQRHEGSHKEFRELMSEIRGLLNRILDKLPDRLN
jgi:hypothetical protein